MPTADPNPPGGRFWRSPGGARWAQAIVGGVIALVLAAVLVSALRVVDRAQRTVASGEGERLLHGVRPVVDHGGSRGALDDAVQRLAPEGLRCIALFDAAGHVRTRAGTCLASDAAMQAMLLTTHPGQAVPVGERLAFVHRLPPPRPPGRPGPPPDGPAREWRPRPPPGAPPPRGPGGQPFLIEFEPVQAEALGRAAMRSVVAGFAATAALVVATIIFWRLSSRAERLQEAVERDRRLASLGEMSAVLAHEIRNPLASLKGHGQLLLESLPPDDARHERAEWVVREAARLENLCEDLLSLVRATRIAPIDTDPAALLREAADGIGGAAIALDLTRAPARWPLDPVRMHQVLANLLRNALQASPAGETVTASIGVEHGALLFTVRDRGGGIPPGDEARIFEPFRTTRIRGTGLGLAVARRIVELHGGSIAVGHPPGGGAELQVRIPRPPLA